MDMLREAGRLLEVADYETRFDPSRKSLLYFESAALVGFVAEYSSGSNLLSAWEAQQDAFLVQYARALRAAPSKAWTVYSVHLCSAAPSPAESALLATLEEDFRGSRKIARMGVSTPNDVLVALLPILPIHNQVVLQLEDIDSRIETRLELLPPRVAHGLRNGTPATILADWLLETP
jgi:hypothetical protein